MGSCSLIKHSLLMASWGVEWLEVREKGGGVKERGRSLGCDEGLGCLVTRFVMEEWTVNTVKVVLGLIQLCITKPIVLLLLQVPYEGS